MTQRTVLHFLEDILKATDAIYGFVLHMNYEAFANDEKTIRAVEREFEIIGEAVKNIPDSFKDKYQDVPWRKIASFRDVLTHGYFRVDLDLVWRITQEDLPKLKKQTEKIKKDLEV